MRADPRRIKVFFYGLFMDQELLRGRGLHPLHARQACVRAVCLRIGKRAALVEKPAHSAYGILMELTHAEIDRLYSEPGLAAYGPEAVTAELRDGSSVPALCYNLPVAPDPDERNPEYAATLRELAERLGLPDHYVKSLG